jgi:hypothetical protein
MSGAIFVKSIVAFPAFAISELFVNFNCPPGSAASESEPLPAAGAGADPLVVDAAGVLGEDGALLLLLLLLELPQAARLSATGSLDKEVSSRAVDETAAASAHSRAAGSLILGRLNNPILSGRASDERWRVGQRSIFSVSSPSSPS